LGNGQLVCINRQKRKRGRGQTSFQSYRKEIRNVIENGGKDLLLVGKEKKQHRIPGGGADRWRQENVNGGGRRKNCLEALATKTGKIEKGGSLK